MSDVFNTTEDEARLIAAELLELKQVLREVSSKLSRIEARAKRAFPVSFPKCEAKRVSSTRAQQAPSITAEEALRLYDEIVAQARGSGVAGARTRLSSMSLPDLMMMRRELGVSLGKRKPSVQALVNGILGRVNESVMMSRHTPRQQLIEQLPETEGLDATDEPR